MIDCSSHPVQQFELVFSIELRERRLTCALSPSKPLLKKLLNLLNPVLS
jgi:hypothetical protein